MILYNVTVKVDNDIHDEWLEWMKNVHIPDVMNTNSFIENRIARLLEMDETDGKTYAIQYIAENMEDYQEYQKKYAPKLQSEHSERYKDKVVAFRTLMEIIS